MDDPNYSTGSGQGTPADKTRQRNEIQREIVMQEADWRRKLAEKTLIESEIRALKKEEDRLRADMQIKQNKLHRIDQEAMQMDAEMKNLKKKLNLIF